MAHTKTIHDEEVDIEIEMPGLYKVVLVNDDVTPVDFVIALLEHVFKHDPKTAKEITMDVHEKGAGVAGVYPYEIAEQKGVEATTISRNNNYPLQIRIEEE